MPLFFFFFLSGGIKGARVSQKGRRDEEGQEVSIVTLGFLAQYYQGCDDRCLEYKHSSAAGIKNIAFTLPCKKIPTLSSWIRFVSCYRMIPLLYMGGEWSTAVLHNLNRSHCGKK